ncbi:MAG: hypothetical protein ACU84Q_12785 [Gammaproteobacteria bacterium]
MAAKPSWRLVNRLRHSSHSGKLIARHRALRTLDFRPASILHPIALLTLCYAVLAFSLHPIELLWQEILGFSIPHLIGNDKLSLQPVPVLALISANVPFPTTRGVHPDNLTLLVATLVSLSLMLVSFLFLRHKTLPLRYLLWAICLVQILACAIFYLAPDKFPHTLASHVANGLTYALNLIFIAPLILAVTYFIFDHPLMQKALGALVILIALVVVAPCQYLLHISLLHHLSLVVMPCLFIFFGLLFNIAVFIAIYAWCVSWES